MATEHTSQQQAELTSNVKLEPRKRGRPRKETSIKLGTVIEPDDTANKHTSQQPAEVALDVKLEPRKRGRPRKKTSTMRTRAKIRRVDPIEVTVTENCLTSPAGSCGDGVVDEVKSENGDLAGYTAEYTSTAESSDINAISHFASDVMPSLTCIDVWPTDGVVLNQAHTDVMTHNDAWVYDDAIASQARNEWQLCSDIHTQVRNDGLESMQSVKTEPADMRDPLTNAGNVQRKFLA